MGERFDGRNGLRSIRPKPHRFSSIETERGRYYNIQRYRKCHLYNKDVEYHFTLVGSLFEDVRRKYINLHFTRYFSAYKYIQLIKSIRKRSKDLINIGKCIYLTY